MIKVELNKMGFRGNGTYAIIEGTKDTGRRVEINSIEDIENANGNGIQKIA